MKKDDSWAKENAAWNDRFRISCKIFNDAARFSDIVRRSSYKDNLDDIYNEWLFEVGAEFKGYNDIIDKRVQHKEFEFENRVRAFVQATEKFRKDIDFMLEVPNLPYEAFTRLICAKSDIDQLFLDHQSILNQ